MPLLCIKAFSRAVSHGNLWDKYYHFYVSDEGAEKEATSPKLQRSACWKEPRLKPGLSNSQPIGLPSALLHTPNSIGFFSCQLEKASTCYHRDLRDTVPRGTQPRVQSWVGIGCL